MLQREELHLYLIVNSKLTTIINLITITITSTINTLITLTTITIKNIISLLFDYTARLATGK